jgi:tRNA(Ile)-lysidine synthase TilS/MesJ
MSMLYAAEIKTMMPKLRSTNHEGMELIRPMYKIHEDDIIAWKRYNHLQFIQCACRVTERIQTEDAGSKRQEMKILIKNLSQINPNIDTNIFRSIHNINLDTIIGYRQGNDYYNFLDDYDK